MPKKNWLEFDKIWLKSCSKTSFYRVFLMVFHKKHQKHCKNDNFSEKGQNGTEKSHLKIFLQKTSKTSKKRQLLVKMIWPLSLKRSFFRGFLKVFYRLCFFDDFDEIWRKKVIFPSFFAVFSRPFEAAIFWKSQKTRGFLSVFSWRLRSE